MPNRCLYLHELIDIVGTGSEAYKEHTGHLGTGRSDGGAPLVGTWQQSGSTGTWPLVVNLWEMRGWDHWSEILERQYTRGSGQDPTLRTWWAEATKYRSGGFDRILEPAPFSPTRQQLVDQGVKGRAVLQEIATVKPGRAERYLDAVATRWRPIAQQHGLTLIGAYRTAMRDTEAMLLWNVPDFAVLTRHLATFARDRAVRRWMEHAHTWRVDYRETLLVPSVWCVTHPDWRDGGRGGTGGRRRAR
jgi:NIPSNAP protein